MHSCKRRQVIGGSCHTFTNRGCEFDTGLHYVGGKVLDLDDGSRQLFDYVTNGMLEWTPLDPEFDIAVVNGERMAMPSGLSKLRSVLYDSFPAERIVIDDYFEAVHEWDGLFFVVRALGGLTPTLLMPLWRRLTRKYLALTGITVKARLDQIGASPRLQGTLGECTHQRK